MILRALDIVQMYFRYTDIVLETLDYVLTWAFMGWQMAMYRSTVKAERERVDMLTARNWE